MLDDSLGALTRSVYDASAVAQQTFVKLLPKLTDMETKANMFTAHLNQYRNEMALALQTSSMYLKRALMESSTLTNGISDGAASGIIHSVLKSLEKANGALIRAIEHKNMLRMSLESEGKIVASALRNLQGKTQKSFAVLSVAEKICEGAKSVHAMSKDVVERSERAHLAQTFQPLHEGTESIRKILGIIRGMHLTKPIRANEILPRTIDNDLELAFARNSRAIAHAQHSLSLSGPVRAREVVDVRDQIRNSLDYEQDAMATKATVVDPAVDNTVIPYTTSIPKVVSKELRPAIQAHERFNDAIIEKVDPSRALHIIEGLSNKVLKQSSVMGATLVSSVLESRRMNYSKFF